MQADITTNAVLLALLHYDLLQGRIVLYRRLDECPRTGTILKVRNPREDEDEVCGMARDAVHDGMRLEGMNCVCYPVDGENGGSVDGVNSTLSSTGVNGVLINGVNSAVMNGVNGNEDSQHAEEDERVNESMDESGSSSDEDDDSDDSDEDDDEDDDDAAAEAQLQADVEAAAVSASDASDASDTEVMDFYDSISETRSESAPRDDERDYLLYPYNC